MEEQKVPFESENKIPKFNKDVANAVTSVIFQPPKTTTLVIKYPKKNEKNENIFIQWEFTMKNQGIAQQWLKFLEEHKQDKLREKNVKNPEVVGNVVSGTLFPKKEENEKEE